MSSYIYLLDSTDHLLPTAIEMSDEPPPYTPQALSDILPIYHPANTNQNVSIYTLHQTSPDQLLLTLRDHPSESATTYTSTLPVCRIRTNKTGGFMNRKPHVIITTSDSDESLKRPLAEGRFDIHGTGTTITYSHEPNTEMIQRLELEDSASQRLRTTIWGHEHWWMPNPGNRAVMELTNEMNEIVARFVHTGPVSQMTGFGRSDSSGKKRTDKEELGDLHIVDALAEGGRAEVICSAMVVVERAKRRARNISCAGIKKSTLAASVAPGLSGGFI